MSLQTIIGGLKVPDVPGVYNSAFAFGEYALDASGEKWGVVFAVPKTGTIAKVGFRVGSVTSAQTLRVGLETVSTTTGLPTGTQYGGSAVGTQASPAADTAYTVALGTGASATAGDVVAAVVQFDGTTGNLGLSRWSADWRGNFPYHVQDVGGWAKQGGDYRMILWIEYDDGSYAPIGTIPVTATANHDFNSTSTPDERALKVTLPFPTRVRGAWWLQGSTFANYDVVLYQGTTALATISVDVDQIEQAGGQGVIERLFPTPQAIAANVAHYLAFKPTSGTDIRVRSIDVAAAAVFDSMDGGQGIHYAERTDAGAWSATTTRRLVAGLILDQFGDDAATGGGLLRPVGQSGGLV